MEGSLSKHLFEDYCPLCLSNERDVLLRLFKKNAILRVLSKYLDISLFFSEHDIPKLLR